MKDQDMEDQGPAPALKCSKLISKKRELEDTDSEVEDQVDVEAPPNDVFSHLNLFCPLVRVFFLQLFSESHECTRVNILLTKRSSKRNMSKTFLMKIRNICSADDLAASAYPHNEIIGQALPAQPPALRPCNGLQPLLGRTLAGLSMTATARKFCLAVERRLEQGQWRIWLKFPAGRPRHWAGL